MDECIETTGGRDALCEVKVFTDGRVERVAAGAPLSAGVRWTPEGDLAVLVNRSPVNKSGDLIIWNEVGGVQLIAAGVSAFDIAPGRVVLGLANGALRGWSVKQPHRAVTLLDSVVSMKVAARDDVPDLLAVALDRGGRLHAVFRTWTTRVLMRGDVEEYSIAPSAKFVVALTGRNAARQLRIVPLDTPARTRVLGEDVISWAISVGTDAIAFIDGAKAAPTLRLVQGDGGATELAPGVRAYRWAPAAPVLGWIQGERRELYVMQSGDAPRLMAENVVEFELSRNGQLVTYVTEQASAAQKAPSANPPWRARWIPSDQGPFSPPTSENELQGELHVARLEPEVQRGPIFQLVRAFGVWPDGSGLVVLDECSGRDPHQPCTLGQWPASGREGDASRVKKISGLVTRFKLGDRSSRVIFEASYSPQDPPFVWATATPKNLLVDEGVDFGTLTLLPPRFEKVAYVVKSPGRAGVYIADLGDWGR